MASSYFKRVIAALTAIFILTSLTPLIASEKAEAPTRDEIPDEYKWDLTDFFPGDSAWEVALEEFKNTIPVMEKYQGQLAASSETLAECLYMQDSLNSMAHRLYVYASLKLDEDNRIGKYQEMRDRIYMAYSKLDQTTSYIGPEITDIPNEKLEQFLNESEELSTYEFYLKDIMRTKKHILSEKEEKILSMVSPVASAPGKIFRMIDDADIEFPTIKDPDGNDLKLTTSRLSQIMRHSDREYRRRAYEAYNETYEKYMNALGATLSSSVQADNFYTTVRGYETNLERSLDGNNIPTSVFHNLIDAVNENLTPLHKYTSLRKKYLDVDTLFGFDMSVPLVPEAHTEYEYEEAKKMVLDALQPLGDDYLASLQTAFESRWIDVYETDGKGSGAYSWGTYSVHPIMLLNYADQLDDVFTLAHELGHAMHSFYTYQSEPYIYAGHSLFTAEVASTCNEAIMIKYMLERAKTREEKLYLLNYYINQIKGTFYTQVWFSEFEHKIHEVVEQGGALSAESMRQMYRDIYEKYYGPDYFIPEMRDMGCLRIGHFYRMYYVYQYATSYAAAQMLSKKILDGEPGAKDAYLEFIKTGSSAYPIDILKKAGIDMTSPEPVNYVVRLFSDLVDQFETLLLEES